MKTKLLEKLREEAKKNIQLYPCGFESAYSQQFSHDSTPVEIHMFCTQHLSDSSIVHRCLHYEPHTIDGVYFVYGYTIPYGWGWYGTCELNQAKKIIRELRMDYILKKVEDLKKERLFQNNKKEYENFKKYLEIL